MGSPGKAFPVTSKTVEELHTLALSLTETIEEKNLSLSHQKSTNKALGVRVSELENKLKSVENSAIKICSERLKLSAQKQGDEFAFFTASFDESISDDFKPGDQGSKLLYSEIPAKKSVSFDKSAGAVDFLSDQTETSHSNFHNPETKSDGMSYVTNGEITTNGHITENAVENADDVTVDDATIDDVTIDDATTNDVTIEDSELEKCLSDWAKHTSVESQSSSPTENDVPNLDKLLMSGSRVPGEISETGAGVTNLESFE